jgi:hypothetical protein
MRLQADVSLGMASLAVLWQIVPIFRDGKLSIQIKNSRLRRLVQYSKKTTENKLEALSYANPWELSSKGRIVQVTHRTRDASYMGRIIRWTHHTRDKSYKGHIVHGTHSTRGALYKWRILQGRRDAREVWYKGCIIQGMHRTRETRFVLYLAKYETKRVLLDTLFNSWLPQSKNRCILCPDRRPIKSAEGDTSNRAVRRKVETHKPFVHVLISYKRGGAKGGFIRWSAASSDSLQWGGKE